jgi:hypothetical protein
MSWVRDSIRVLNERHERLKNFIHNGFRYPLPRHGQILMGMVYFSIPVIGGWYIMQWAISKSHHSIGLNGENLPNKSGIQGLGDQRAVVVKDSEHREEIQYHKVGAGGWGGGVHLAMSDEETQQRNHQMLRKFLKLQRKRNESQTQEIARDD